MKTLLEAIQKHTDTFIYTLRDRQMTSLGNKEAHQEMIDAITLEDWKGVSEKLTDVWYRKPLEGVVFCLRRWDIDQDEHFKIVDLLEEEKFV